MAKKAVLIKISLMARVVIDDASEEEANKERTTEEIQDMEIGRALELATPNFIERLRNSEAWDNFESIEDDTEIPYGTLEGEK